MTPDLPHSVHLKPVDWRAALAEGGALTPAQLQAIGASAALPESLRELVTMALEGSESANWMLGLAINAGTVRLRPQAAPDNSR